MSFDSLLADAGRPVTGRRMWAEAPSYGWAVGKFTLEQPTTVLARCDAPFLVGFGSHVYRTPDVYDERRAVSALPLDAGEHVLAIMAPEGGFWCELFEDKAGGQGANVRSNMTKVADGSDAESPLILLSDSQMSDVVDGILPTNFLSVPVLNVLKEPLSIIKAEVVEPEWLQIKQPTLAQIAPGQQQPLRLELEDLAAEKRLPCNEKHVFSLKLRLTPSQGAAQETTLTSKCTPAFKSSGGYVVTYPDFDGSIQRAFVSPPNLSQSEGFSCPAGGCPALLSLHGAAVRVDDLGQRTFSYGNGTFPFAAWLVMPTNRYHWGTDWEGQGLDNALAAMAYVREHQPGIVSGIRARVAELQAGQEEAAGKASSTLEVSYEAETQAFKKRYAMHPSRIVLHGHSMGGHGCYVLGAHFPDGLMGMACAAGWSSMGSSHAKLLDGTREGLRHAPLAEHSADLLSANLFGIPFLVTYGDNDDNVPPNEPRYMARLVRSFSSHGSAVVVREERSTGHWFEQRTPAIHAFLRHLLHGEGPPLEAVRVAARAARLVDASDAAATAKQQADQARQDAEQAQQRAKELTEAAQHAKAQADAAEAAATKPKDAGLQAAELTEKMKNLRLSDQRRTAVALLEVNAAGMQSLASAAVTDGLDVDMRFDAHAARRQNQDLGVTKSQAVAQRVVAEPVRRMEALKTTRSKVDDFFDMYDRNKDGVITRADFEVAPEVSRERPLPAGPPSEAEAHRFDGHDAPPPSALSRDLPPLPPYFEFQVTNPSTFGTKGNLQILQLEAPHAPGKLLVSRLAEKEAAQVAAMLAARGSRGAASLAEQRLLEVLQHNASGDADAETWVVRTYNVRRFRLKNPPMPGIPLPRSLVLDGVKFQGIELGGDEAPLGRHFCRRHHNRWHLCDETEWAHLERGTSLQSGPLQMTLRRAPMCIVHYGQAHASEGHAVSLANRMYFVSRYMPMVLNGNDVGPEDSAEAQHCSSASNVILLGDAARNPWTKHFACAVRYVKFLKDGGYVIGGERYVAPGTGLLAFGVQTNSNKRVLLVAGVDEVGLAQASRSVPVSSGQLTTDFAVYGARASWAGAGGLLAAGYVDHLWQVSPGPLGASFAEPEPPALAPRLVPPSDSMASGAAGGSLAEGLLQRLSSWAANSLEVTNAELLLPADLCDGQDSSTVRADVEIDGAEMAEAKLSASQSRTNTEAEGSKTADAAATEDAPASRQQDADSADSSSSGADSSDSRTEAAQSTAESVGGRHVRHMEIQHSESGEQGEAGSSQSEEEGDKASWQNSSDSTNEEAVHEQAGHGAAKLTRTFKQRQAHAAIEAHKSPLHAEGHMEDRDSQQHGPRMIRSHRYAKPARPAADDRPVEQFPEHEHSVALPPATAHVVHRARAVPTPTWGF
eukprot:TRINITY_DN110716_c0_g1_i1.p1 TRINITY_DN110716_c0_g1~~TRINITY_DN110716_c0_g1_i1.p1  ORF type:complete len:1602 (+),score=394.52 TRINITY_DN110716_c0_g1_i1:623-4807(+)